MPFDWTVLSGAASRTISLRRLFNRFPKATVFSPRHEEVWSTAVFKDSAESRLFEPMKVFGRPGNIDGGAFAILCFGGFEFGCG